jgi:NUMOD4 motif./HNH endonuclease.
MEIIVEIEGFPDYLISNLGYVISKERKVNNGRGYRIKKLTTLNISLSRGYQMVTIYRDGKAYFKSLHRLLAKAFIPNPDNKPYINHIDHNRGNNTLTNLEWCTPKENIDAFWIHAKNTNLNVHINRVGKQVINIVTGVEYNSIREASRVEKIDRNTLKYKLRGEKPNNTNLIFKIL